MKPFAVMFVCTGNICRSPMAEIALRSLLERERPEKAEVFSSGIATTNGIPASDYAVEAVKIWDCDLSAHQSRQLTIEDIQRSDLILAMSPEHVGEVIRIDANAESKSYLFKNFPDPSPYGEAVDDPIGQSLSKYNETFLEIGEFLGKCLSEIVQRIDEKARA